jgi:signal transduction histidine kinase
VGRSSGARLTLAIDPLAELEPDTVKAELCLIAEEAIGNAVRHGRAGRVEVELRAGRGNLTLAIRDDGVGFDGARSLGIGIESMRARARSLGGSLEVATAEGGGTVVRCAWPAAARPPRLTP